MRYDADRLFVLVNDCNRMIGSTVYTDEAEAAGVVAAFTHSHGRAVRCLRLDRYLDLLEKQDD